MKNALISPNEQVQYISAWVLMDGTYEPIYSVAGQRVAEVAQNIFPVAPPLFWVECADDVTAETYCYVDNACVVIPPDVPKPESVQQAIESVQTP